MQYSVKDLVRLAKRDNNVIRPYLYVNPMQGKHIPTRPEDVFGMCHELANIVNAAYPTDLLYVIGFAETATGIASAVSHYLNNVIYYQNTTREYCEDEEYLYFTESHSHATDQMLRSLGVDNYIKNVNRILFIDDEVTTGSTICKLIEVLKEKYAVENISYSIASILNSMTEERIHQLMECGIECLFLSDMPFEYKKESIVKISYDSEKHTVIKTSKRPSLDEINFESLTNPRGIVKFEEYDNENRLFSHKIEHLLWGKYYKNMLVLGTEEFMYPAFCIGEMIKKKGIADDVKIHATTRSPIVASDKKDYPLYHRYQLRSLYDETRTTFIYNLTRYDKVLILTDTENKSAGVFDLFSALERVGNCDITLARWKYIH